jgi:hypothetical protein
MKNPVFNSGRKKRRMALAAAVMPGIPSRYLFSCGRAATKAPFAAKKKADPLRILPFESGLPPFLFCQRGAAPLQYTFCPAASEFYQPKPQEIAFAQRKKKISPNPKIR